MRAIVAPSAPLAPTPTPHLSDSTQQTFDKKKVTDKLAIPLTLDMGAVLAAAGLPLPAAAPTGADGGPVLPGAPNSRYELVAVLIHKGTSASHGHYGEGVWVCGECVCGGVGGGGWGACCAGRPHGVGVCAARVLALVLARQHLHLQHASDRGLACVVARTPCVCGTPCSGAHQAARHGHVVAL
jgi:hypothetical protein